MLKDITFGQYFPGESIIHRLDPRMKLLLIVAYIVLLFVADGLFALLIGAAMVVMFYALSKLPWKLVIKCIKPIMPIIIFTAVLNIFFVEGDPIFEWQFISVSGKGLLTAVLMCIRIICLIAGSSLLTYTTTPIALTDGLERLMKPLQKIKVPVHELSMMMTIALRFIPTLIDETQKIMAAQKARGADMESGNIIQRAKALIPILIPLFVSAFRHKESHRNCRNKKLVVFEQGAAEVLEGGALYRSKLCAVLFDTDKGENLENPHNGGCDNCEYEEGGTQATGKAHAAEHTLHRGIDEYHSEHTDIGANSCERADTLAHLLVLGDGRHQRPVGDVVEGEEDAEEKIGNAEKNDMPTLRHFKVVEEQGGEKSRANHTD